MLVMKCVRIIYRLSPSHFLCRYGILIDPFMWIRVFISNPYSWPSFCLVLSKSLQHLCSVPGAWFFLQMFILCFHYLLGMSTIVLSMSSTAHSQ